MAKGKPLIFSKKPGSEVRRAAKVKAESAFKAGALPQKPPADLAGMPEARAAWRQLMRAHRALPGELFNELDRDYLIAFCLAVQARARALDLERAMSLKWAAGEVDISTLLSTRSELRQTIRLCSDLSKQLFATPKSRGGVTPSARQPTPEEVVDFELQQLNKILGDG